MISVFSPKQKKNSQCGLSLIELAIVLGIIGIVLGALWGVVSIVGERVKRGQLGEQVTTAVMNIRSFYLSRSRVADNAGNRDYAALTDFLLRQGVLPTEMIRDRTAAAWVADTPWGPVGASGGVLANGGFAVRGLDIAGVDISDTAFLVEVRGLNYSSCVEVASNLSGANPSGLMRASINGVVIPYVTPDQASVECQRAPGGNANIVAFQYRLRQD